MLSIKTLKEFTKTKEVLQSQLAELEKMKPQLSEETYEHQHLRFSLQLKTLESVEPLIDSLVSAAGPDDGDELG